jgi:type I restriction enzyme S subunit
MPQFIKYKLTTLCSKIGSGATPRGGDAVYKSHGISLIRSQNILDFTFSTNGLAFIDEEQAKELANVELKARDVLLNITGDSVARVSQVPANILPARVNQHVAIIRANQQKLNPEFLKYSLLSKPNQEKQ